MGESGRRGRRADAAMLREIAVAAYGPTLLASIGTGAVVPVIALSARELGASLGVAALLVAVLGVGTLLGDLPSGAIAARVGERRALLMAAVVDAVGMLLAGLAGGLVALFAGVLVIGLAASLFGLARQVYLTEVVPIRLRARALSTLGGVHRIGAFLGPFAGTVVIARWGTGGAYYLGAVASAAAFVLVLVAPDITVRSDSAARRGSGPTQSVASVLLQHRRVLLTVGTGVMCIAGARAVREALVPLWAESVGLTAAQISLVFGIAGAVDMLLFYPSGWVMDRRGRVAVAVPSMVVLAAGMMLLPVTTTFGSVTLVACVLGFGNGIGSGLIMTLGADVSPLEGRAQFLGGWRLCADLGRAVGPLALSGLSAVLTLGASAVVLSVGVLLSAGWLRLWVPGHDPVRRRRDGGGRGTGSMRAGGPRGSGSGGPSVVG